MNDQQKNQRAEAILRLTQAQLMLKSGKEQLATAQKQIEDAERLIAESAQVLNTLGDPQRRPRS